MSMSERASFLLAATVALVAALLLTVAISDAVAAGARVTAVDGTSVTVRDGATMRTVRLAGVAVPAGCQAAAARAGIAGVLNGKSVQRTGNRLRLGRRDAGQTLVERGLVSVARGRFTARKRYLAAQAKARKAGRGIWAACPASPGGPPVLPRPGAKPPEFATATAPAAAAAAEAAPAAASPGGSPTPDPSPPAPPPPPAGGPGVPGPIDRPFATGTPALRTIDVDPAGGGDVRTIAEAWAQVPRDVMLTEGVRIRLAPGTYPQAAMPNYWEARHGTAAAPVVIEAPGGAGSVTLGNINAADLRHVYFVGITIDSAFDVFHCERCDHVLIRDAVLRGRAGVHENVKINQSQHVFIERSDISGAGDNAIDFVAVQYGHLLNNRISGAGDWCAYVKGGSSYLRVAGNEISGCGTGGFTAGQGTGFQFMTSPWLYHEVHDVKVYDNEIHDTEGAGLGVNGGYDVLLAHNTLRRVGARSHVLEIVPGSRSCDPGEGQDRCNAYNAAGGWGPVSGGADRDIPNDHVFVFNNVIVGSPSRDQHLDLRQADDVRIAGNVFQNGPPDHPSGLAPGPDAQFRADNHVNTLEPTPANLATLHAVPHPAFSWSDAPGGIPQGTLDNTIPGAPDRPGAF